MPDFAGIYEVAETARYLQATAFGKRPAYQAVRRWTRSGLPYPTARSIPAKDLFLVFVDLVSLRMIVCLRQAGFSLQHIRKVHQWLQEAMKCDRPFAVRELWISESEVFINMERQWLSATRQGQYAMDFVKQWLSSLGPPDRPLDMTFTASDGFSVASSWKPRPYILLDPLIQFGTPCIEGTRIPTRAVWSMVRGGDSPKAIARDYGVALDKIEAAIEWEQRLASLAA